MSILALFPSPRGDIEVGIDIDNPIDITVGSPAVGIDIEVDQPGAEIGVPGVPGPPGPEGPPGPPGTTTRWWVEPGPPPDPCPPGFGEFDYYLDSTSGDIYACGVAPTAMVPGIGGP